MKNILTIKTPKSNYSMKEGGGQHRKPITVKRCGISRYTLIKKLDVIFYYTVSLQEFIYERFRLDRYYIIEMFIKTKALVQEFLQ